MWFNHVESLEKVLRSAFNEQATESQRPYWLLLFELYILEGKMAEFEDLGLEYAVAFEMSPPSWEMYVNTVAAAAAKARDGRQARAAEAPAPGGGLRPEGRAVGGELQPDRRAQRLRRDRAPRWWST